MNLPCRAAFGAVFLAAVGGAASAQTVVDIEAYDLGEAANTLGLDRAPTVDDVDVFDEYVGESYGALTAECAEAIRLTARTEGVMLDPVYSGKAMAGLIDLIRRGVIKKDETVIFLHTGGHPALFAYPPDALIQPASEPALPAS